MTRLLLLAALLGLGCGGPDGPIECAAGGELEIVPFEGPSVDRTFFACDVPDGNWLCYLGPSYSGLIFSGTNVYCGFEHAIGFRFLPDAPYFATVELTLDENGVVIGATAVTGDASDRSKTRPAESGTLAIEGGRIDPDGDRCVRGHLTFVSGGVTVEGQFRTDPCWNF